jgi:GT2 family glycosyltransferase
MTISAVLVNFNSGDTILQAIQSLIEQGDVWDEITVVDNGSSDGSSLEVERCYPFVRIIALGENQGLSRARNAGLAAIQSDHVLFVDDDVYLSPGSLKKMMGALAETGASVVCPRVLLHPERDIVQCDGAGIHFMGVLSMRHPFRPAASTLAGRVMTSGFIGACMLFDAKLLRSLGGFDEDYFFYFEDLELSYRMTTLGYKICCEPGATVLHERGSGTENLSFRGKGAYPARRAYFTLRHRWLTIAIHYQLRTLLLLLPAFALYEFAAFVEVLRRGWVREYFGAVFSLARLAPSVFKKRARWQLARKVFDRDILSAGPLPFSRGFVEDGGKKKWVVVLDVLLNFYWEKIKRWL